MGEFHDLVIQQEYLLNISEELVTKGKENQTTFLSIGSLVGTLQNEKKDVKDAFAEVFLHFKSQENRLLYQELFQGEANS